jgi:hypothetical protein
MQVCVLLQAPAGEWDAGPQVQHADGGATRHRKLRRKQGPTREVGECDTQPHSHDAAAAGTPELMHACMSHGTAV